MKQINIQVIEKIAKLTNPEEYLVCGNDDYKLVFDFDEEWAEYPVKTALFVYGSDSVPKVFEGNVCEGVAIHNATECAVGVFAGDIRTTTGAFINCKTSITDIGKTPKAPDPDVYNQIMELLQKAIQAHTELPTGGSAGQVLVKKSDEDYDTEWKDIQIPNLDEYQKKTDDTLPTQSKDVVGAITETFWFVDEAQVRIASNDDRITELENSIGGVSDLLSEVVDGGAF